MVHIFFEPKNIMKFISSAMILSSATAFSFSSETDGDIVDCDTFGPQLTWSPETFGPCGQMVQVCLVTKDIRSQRHLVPLD